MGQILQLNPLQPLQQIRALGNGAGRIGLGVPDDALRIDEKRRAHVQAALIIEDAVRLANLAMRPVVRQQRKRDATEFFSPLLETGNGVGAQLQDFNIELLELIVVRTEPTDLIGSSAGECQGKKGHHDAAAAITTERHGLAGMRCQRKVRCRSSCLKCSHTALLENG